MGDMPVNRNKKRKEKDKDIRIEDEVNTLYASRVEIRANLQMINRQRLEQHRGNALKIT